MSSIVLGEEHGKALVVADPAGVAISAVGEMRREQSVKVIIGEFPLQWLESESFCSTTLR